MEARDRGCEGESWGIPRGGVAKTRQDDAAHLLVGFEGWKKASITN